MIIPIICFAQYQGSSACLGFLSIRTWTDCLIREFTSLIILYNETNTFNYEMKMIITSNNKIINLIFVLRCSIYFIICKT